MFRFAQFATGRIRRGGHDTYTDCHPQMRREIPILKLQIPGKSQPPKSQLSCALLLWDLAGWNLIGIWFLGFGISRKQLLQFLELVPTLCADVPLW